MPAWSGQFPCRLLLGVLPQRVRRTGYATAYGLQRPARCGTVSTPSGVHGPAHDWAARQVEPALGHRHVRDVRSAVHIACR